LWAKSDSFLPGAFLGAQEGIMGRFAENTKTIHADWWGKKDEVVIRELSYGDAEQIDFESTELIKDEATGESLIKMNLSKRRVLRTFTAIVSWTFERPLTLDAVRNLTQEDGLYIYEKILELGKVRSAEEQETFRDGAGDAAESGQTAA